MDMRHSASFGPSSQGRFLEQSRKTVEKCLVVLCKETSVSPVCLITVNLAVGLHNCFSVLIGKQLDGRHLQHPKGPVYQMLYKHRANIFLPCSTACNQGKHQLFQKKKFKKIPLLLPHFPPDLNKHFMLRKHKKKIVTYRESQHKRNSMCFMF